MRIYIGFLTSSLTSGSGILSQIPYPQRYIEFPSAFLPRNSPELPRYPWEYTGMLHETQPCITEISYENATNPCRDLL